MPSDVFTTKSAHILPLISGILEEINTPKSKNSGGMSRISGLRNDMNKRTFYKKQKINKRRIHFLSKQNIKVPLILDIYEYID